MPRGQSYDFDEQGRPYWVSGQGYHMGQVATPAQDAAYQNNARVGRAVRHYIDPAHAGALMQDPQIAAWAGGMEKPDEGPLGGFFHEDTTFNSLSGEYERPIDWARIAQLAGAGVGGYGAAATLAAGGGAAAASGAAGAGTTAAVPSAGLVGAMPAVSGTTAMTAAPASLGAAGAGGGGMWGSILNGVLNNADTIANVGRVASGAAQGSAEQRVNEADARVRADQLTRRSQLLAALLGGLQDARVTSGNPNIRARTPQVSGGFRPSAMLGDGRREALMQILSRPVEFPEAGAAERILGGVGIGAGLLGAATSGRR